MSSATYTKNMELHDESNYKSPRISLKKSIPTSSASKSKNSNPDGELGKTSLTKSSLEPKPLFTSAPKASLSSMPASMSAEPTLKTSLSVGPLPSFTSNPKTSSLESKASSSSLDPKASFASEPKASFASEPKASFASEPKASFASEPKVSLSSSEPKASFTSESKASLSSSESKASFASEPKASFASDPKASLSSESNASFITESKETTSSESSPVGKMDVTDRIVENHKREQERRALAGIEPTFWEKYGLHFLMGGCVLVFLIIIVLIAWPKPPTRSGPSSYSRSNPVSSSLLPPIPHNSSDISNESPTLQVFHFNDLPYIVSASSTCEQNYPIQAFDTSSNGAAWVSSSSQDKIVTTTSNGSVHSGEWLQIQLPTAAILTSYELATIRDNILVSNAAMPTDFGVFGSTDGISWSLLDQRSSVQWTNTQLYNFTINGEIESTKYSYFRLVCYSSANHCIANWSLYGLD